MKTITVFGSTGKTGGKTVKAALNRGLMVRAYVRRQRSLYYTHKDLEVIQGSLEDSEKIGGAVNRSDAVIVTIGPRAPFRDIFCAVATSTIISAMKKNRPGRLIAVTGAMIGDGYDANLSPFMMKMKRTSEKKMADMMKDRAQQEKIIKESGLDWTIVKPPRLSDRKFKGRYKTGPAVKVGMLSSIGREDLSDFLISLAENNSYIKETVFIKY